MSTYETDERPTDFRWQMGGQNQVVYQKSVQLGFANAVNTWHETPHHISGLDRVIGFTATTNSPAEDYFRGLPHWNAHAPNQAGASHYAIQFFPTTVRTNTFNTNLAALGWTGWVTLWYTKTS